MKKVLATITAMITVISVVFGVHFFNERTYAKDKKVSLLELRIEQKIVQDMIDADKKELRVLKREYGKDAKKITDNAFKEEIQKDMDELEESVSDNKEFMKEIKKRLLPAPDKK